MKKNSQIKYLYKWIPAPNSIYQLHFFQIDEKGTKASGVTAITLTRSSSPPLIEFNHPFVVLIREIDSNSVLFMGRVANPVG